METKALTGFIGTKAFLYTLAAIVVLFVVYQVMKRTGLIKTFAQRKTARLVEKSARNEKITTGTQKAQTKDVKILLSASDFFNPALWKDQSADLLMKQDVARSKATNIRSALKGPGTNESKVMKAFRNLTSKYMVSQIAFHYAANFKRDLLTDLVSDMNKTELNELYNIIKILK